MFIKKYNLNNFLLVKVPLSILILVVIIELFALLLSDYRAIRHGLDRKVAKIEYKNKNKQHEILLFGDSVTKDLADEFNLSDNKKNTLNLTTNRASGLIGAYMLYNKLRKNDISPKYIIVSSTPKFLTFFPKNETKELYLSSVFNLLEEKEIISNYYNNLFVQENDISASSFLRKSKLSVFNLKLKIGYPLIHALGFINVDDALLLGEKSVLSQVELSNTFDDKKIKLNFKKNSNEDAKLIISDNTKKLIKDFFRMLKEDNVKVYIAWAPMRINYYKNIRLNGELEKLEEFLNIEANKINLNLSITDFSKGNQFPASAFRDNDHLQIGYWRHFYAIQLKNLIVNVN